MRITNRTRNTLLGSRIALASTWWSRLRGFLGRSEPQNGEGILLVDCNAIHSFGMKFPLDVLFLDGKGKVLRTLRSLRPWRMPRRVSGATYVLEVPEGTIDLSGTEVGDDLTWGESASYSISVRSEGRTERRVSPAPGERSTA